MILQIISANFWLTQLVILASPGIYFEAQSSPRLTCLQTRGLIPKYQQQSPLMLQVHPYLWATVRTVVDGKALRMVTWIWASVAWSTLAVASSIHRIWAWKAYTNDQPKLHKPNPFFIVNPVLHHHNLSTAKCSGPRPSSSFIEKCPMDSQEIRLPPNYGSYINYTARNLWPRP